MAECTFKPKLNWGNRVALTSRRKPIAKNVREKSSVNTNPPPAHLSAPSSGNGSAHEETTNSDDDNEEEEATGPDTKSQELSSSPLRTPKRRDIMKDNLSPLRKHHEAMRTRNRRDYSYSSVPIEIITTTETTTVFQTRRGVTSTSSFVHGPDDPVSPLRLPNIPIHAVRDLEESPLAPRLIFSAMMDVDVGCESLAGRTQQTEKTEYGSI